MSMSAFVYILGTVTSLLCAILLLRGYARSHKRLLLWSGLCFLGLTVSHFLVFIDLEVLPNVDLYPVRLGIAAVALFLQVWGLIFESE